jgi:phosphoglycerate dehydrogenase-like enzyme
VVSLHVPAVPETRRLIGRTALARMKPEAFLVNTARGSVLDEIALFDALKEGRLAGAALDVFEREPYVPADSARDLRTLPNVILTPHVGSATAEACARMAALAIENVRRIVAGRDAEAHIVNPDVRERLRHAREIPDGTQ